MTFKLISKFELLGDDICLLAKKTETGYNFKVLFFGSHFTIDEDANFNNYFEAYEDFKNKCEFMLKMTPFQRLDEYFNQEAKEYNG
jgi:hypothetical protein